MAVGFSSAAILRLSAGATLPYATVGRMTRPLIEVGRWISNARKGLTASDLASLLNAIISLQPTADSAKIDTILRALEYKSSWPPTAEQEPALGEQNWGTLLETLIQNAPETSDMPQPATQNAEVGFSLPNVIETCVNPLSIVLTWFAPDGAPKRQDFYGPTRADLGKAVQPYGKANLLIRKSFLDPQMIVIAGEILRDSSPRTIAATNENAALPGAAPTRNQGRKADNQNGDNPKPRKSDTLVDRRESENPQALSSRRSGPSPQKRRRMTFDARSGDGSAAGCPP